MLFRPPTVAQLKQWKASLGYSGARMAQILGMKTSRRWRDYADENKPQGIPPANLFMGAALVILPASEIELVLEKMREIGATIDLDAESDSPVQGGEQEQ
ncbi:XRE family transcriptional regulator [Paraburkholderia sp. BCC1885]|uniref:XRE family transcriptional regulator n=1 Tax=Paraburkholderia sp. BCC1885 TaxID=2562669 RepID=UPI0011822B29|nr:XRE family transcriptional regulator [Paraburkholderia sp. BCC1885]